MEEGQRAGMEQQPTTSEDATSEDATDYFERYLSKSESFDNQYIKDIINESSPKILRPNMVVNAFKRNGVLGLFHLFITNDLLRTIVYWTNANIDDGAASTKPITLPELKRYIGLEIAMSVVKFNQIQDYWSNDRFLGHPDFQDTMGRQRFTDIRRFLIFRNPRINRYNEPSEDPLWHSRSILNHFMRTSAKYCVPSRASALDESSVRCSGRSRAVTFIPDKPEKFAIRFYGLVCWKSLYLFSLFDNSAGLRSPLSPVARYMALHSCTMPNKRPRRTC